MDDLKKRRPRSKMIVHGRSKIYLGRSDLVHHGLGKLLDGFWTGGFVALVDGNGFVHLHLVSYRIAVLLPKTLSTGCIHQEMSTC